MTDPHNERVWPEGLLAPEGCVMKRREFVRPGDIVRSSHGYRLLITEVLDNAVDRSEDRHVEIRGHLHANPDAVIRNEIYPAKSLIPVEIEELPEQQYVRHTIVIELPVEEDKPELEGRLTRYIERFSDERYGANVLVKEYHHEQMTEPADEYPPCPECGNPIDYCQGHGDIGPERS